MKQILPYVIAGMTLFANPISPSATPFAHETPASRQYAVLVIDMQPNILERSNVSDVETAIAEHLEPVLQKPNHD